MNGSVLKTNRRSFLKLSGLGLAAVIGGGYVAARLTDGTATALLPQASNLTPASQQMLVKVFDAVLADMLPKGNEQAYLVTALTTLDKSISGLPPALSKELLGLLDMLTFAPTRFALAGRWSGWKNASRSDVATWLQALQNSSIELRRLVYITLHDLSTSSFYANPKTWALIGYNGPKLHGPGPEV